VRRPDVSLVICTRDGATRLPAALAHLAAQRTSAGLAWEVLVVDNASTDDTAAVARAAWPAGAPAPLRIVAEPRPGLGHARVRGFEETAGDVVGFVDDDNWLAPDWVEVAAAVMRAHPQAGACGSAGEPFFDGRTPPPWFAENAVAYAVGEPGEAGDVTGRGALWGAGLAVRRAAWLGLRAAGFEPMLVGRRGDRPTAGEDTELCVALIAAGWRLWFDPRLRFRHAIEPARLQWAYARRVHYGFGVSSVLMDYYHAALERRPGLRPRLQRLWAWRMLAATAWWAWYRARGGGEGSRDVLQAELRRGRLRGLLDECGVYARRGRDVRELVRRLAASRG
jgi:glycosyltransferase involved in cell wall biosynthesis